MTDPSDDNEEMRDDLLAYFQHQTMAATESYLRRGRKFRANDIAELKERWVELRKKQFLELDNSDEELREDIESEIGLRGEELPYELIKDAMESFSEHLKAVMAGPRTARMDAAGDEQTKLILDFVREHRKPKH